MWLFFAECSSVYAVSDSCDDDDDSDDTDLTTVQSLDISQGVAMPSYASKPLDPPLVSFNDIASPTAN